ncbi:hypothetical protein [Arcticibacter tournemirensis]|uniref:hypothetical protein n=1 Tax=Arcticibacter tournemirensis TaxID=699437 RepID=UPI001151686F|nr:hypothetical protein [Arcticibacter tournemirensis]
MTTNWAASLPSACLLCATSPRIGARSGDTLGHPFSDAVPVKRGRRVPSGTAMVRQRRGIQQKKRGVRRLKMSRVEGRKPLEEEKV